MEGKALNSETPLKWLSLKRKSVEAVRRFPPSSAAKKQTKKEPLQKLNGYIIIINYLA